MAKIPKSVECYKCKGSGKMIRVARSYSLDSSRSIEVTCDYWEHGTHSETVTCDRCSGKGWVGSTTNPSQCSSCHGNGKITRTISVKEYYKKEGYIVGIFPKFPRTCSCCGGTGRKVQIDRFDMQDRRNDITEKSANNGFFLLRG